MRKTAFLFLFCFYLFASAYGRQTIKPDPLLRDSLLHLGYTIYNEPNEPERLQANYLFIKTLVQLLKASNSFEMDLDTLKMISIKKPANQKLRIFSWHLPLNDGSYRYYGAIQLHTSDGSLRLFPLIDQTPDIGNPDQASLDNNHWFGAQYYDLQEFEGLPDHYILLGWKGTNPKLMQKVIDILWIKDEKIHFGKALFSGTGIAPYITRMVYRYHAQASMLLKFDPDKKRILMDHLAPIDPKFKENDEYYGPDMSYDAWEIQPSKLVLIEDLPLKNEEIK